jgi:hypothetical protein
MSGIFEAAPEVVESEVQSPSEEIVADAQAAENLAPETKEAAPPEKKPEPTQSEEDKRFAAKFAALARKEKALQQQMKQVKAWEEAKKAEEVQKSAPAPKEAPVKPLERRLKENPFETLKELGIDYETLTRMALNDGKATPEIQMELMKQDIREQIKAEMAGDLEELKAFKAQTEKERKEKAEKDQEQTQAQQISNFKGEINDYLSKNKETYELAAFEGQDGIDLIFDVIAQNAAAKQKEREELGEEFTAEDIMSIEEAAKQVEEHLFEQAKKRVNVSKIKGLFGAAPTSTATAPAKKPASVTLSNTNSQVQGGKRAPLSDEEAKLEAAQTLRWIAD